MPNPWDKPQQQTNPWDRPAGPVAGAGPGGPPQLAAHPSVDMEESSPAVSGLLTAGDVAKGAGKGLLHTVSSADEWAGKHLPPVMTTPIGQASTKENSQHAIDTAQSMAAPHNTAQRVGYGAEQAGEFLAPTGVEEGAAKLLAPGLGRAGEVTGRLLGSGVHSGTINKAQGGDFGTGAAAGSVGAGVGEGLKAAAPLLAETALKVRGADRAYGATPGEAILNHTTGFSPAKIVESARGALGDTQAEAGHLLAAAGNSGARVALYPTRKLLSDFVDRADLENHSGTTKDLEKLASQLDTYHSSGKLIPSDVTPLDAGALNRGVSNAITSWNPATSNDTMNAAGKMAHHSLGESIAQVVPEIRPLNQRLASLHPVIQRGTAADLNAGLLQRIVGRFGTPTGALLGGAAGFHYGGIPGAAAGLVVPEMLSNPTTLMMEARAANSPALRNVALPAAKGSLLQMDRK